MDNFDIIKALGEGSFGSALLVQDKKSKKHYVVKKIPLYNLNEIEKEEAMKEVEVLSQMKHPNIITYHKSFEENNALYIVTDYCDGGDLYSKLRAQRGSYFEEDQILDWFVQICLAVKHVHDRRILHRDIKTQNIFLTKSGIAKLGDFGIARILNSTSDLARTCIGTPYYLSPEICENKPYNNKSDVWSLGCVLYELTTLKHAFEAMNIKSLIFKILKGSVPQIPDIYSSELKGLLSQIFVRNPHERPSVNAVLRKPIILERISKFLNQSKIKEEFNQAILKRTAVSVPCTGNSNSSKIKITNPATKYGVSIARKKINKPSVLKKAIVKRNETNLVMKNINQAKIPPAINMHSNKPNWKKQSIMNKKRNANSSNAEEKIFSKENMSIKESSGSEFSYSNKSIIELSSIEFCENSYKINFPMLLPPENKLLSVDTNVSNPVADISESESKLTCCNKSDEFVSNCFENSFQKTAFEINLPLIEEHKSKHRSKWSKPDFDFLKDLPLEMTASKMESTSPNDKMIVYPSRPYSAPHIGRRNLSFFKSEQSNVNHKASKENCTIGCTQVDEDSGFNSNPFQTSSAFININSHEMIKEINDSINHATFNSKENQTEKELDTEKEKCLVSKKTNINSFIKRSNSLGTLSNYSNDNISREKLSNFSEKIETGQITYPSHFSQTFKVNATDINKETENKAVNEVNHPENNTLLPSIPTNDLLMGNEFKTYNISAPSPQTNSMHFHLPSVDGKLESQDSSKNKTYLLLKRNNSCSSINRTYLPTLLEEKIEIPDTKESLNTSNISELYLYSNQSSCELLEEDMHIMNTNTPRYKEEFHKTEIGIQCDIITASYLSLPNSPCKAVSTVQSPAHWTSKTAYKLTNVDRKERLRHRFHSLPDLTALACVPECNGELSSQINAHSSLSTTNDGAVEGSDSSELFLTASSLRLESSDEDEDDLFHVCQTLQFILRQSQNSDSGSIYSSWSIDESYDPYSDVEQMRVDLENKLGLERFLRAYAKIHSLFENGSLDSTDEKKSMNGILEPGFEHICHEILQLIIKEEIYINFPHG